MMYAISSSMLAAGDLLNTANALSGGEVVGSSTSQPPQRPMQRGAKSRIERGVMCRKARPRLCDSLHL